MNLRQLRYFASIVESGSMSEAARRLHIAQPALSRGLAELEDELGTPLLVRSRTGVTPTAAGETLYAQARLIQRQCENAATLVREQSQQRQGRVAIGILRSDAWALAAPLYRTIRAQMPQVQPEILIGYSSELLEQLRLAHLDFTMYVATEGIEMAPGNLLRKERLCLIGSPRFVPVDGGTLPLAHLHGLPLLLTTARPVHRVLLQTAAAQGVDIRMVGGIDDSVATIGICKDGSAATLLPEAGATRLARLHGLHSAVIDEPLLTRRVMVRAHPEIKRSAASLACEEILRQLTTEQMVREAAQGD
jgi:LysR family nitrogen assimilation transcriptional regulator